MYLLLMFISLNAQINGMKQHFSNIIFACKLLFLVCVFIIIGKSQNCFGAFSVSDHFDADPDPRIRFRDDGSGSGSGSGSDLKSNKFQFFSF